MNVLIVDDNKNNRMMLNLLLEEYSETHDTSFNVTEAEDGLLAVKAVEETHFDLVFMDIMMPNMDGIAATSAIRRLDKKIMIIAVSAVEDEERKKVILNNGAEDYISKPVNGDIFNVRLKSYIRLVESRQTKKDIVSTDPFNLFSKDVYTYHMHFHAGSEDMLSNFWEYYLLKNTPYDGISDMVRFIFDMGLAALENRSSLDIHEENSDEYMYLTLISNTSFDPDTIMIYADKNNFDENYKLDGKTLTARLKKEKVLNFIESEPTPVVEDIEEVIASPLYQNEPVETLTVFDFLEYEDLEDLKDFISKLNSLLLILGNSTIEVHEVDELVMTLLQISKVLAAYHELYNVSAALGSLGNCIHGDKETFIQKSGDLGPLAVAFGGDLSKWFKSLFVTGASSIDFLDNSIISNGQMIEQFINPPAEPENFGGDMDDIFDF